MKNFICILLVFCLFSPLYGADDLKLWFRQPAENWNEALPVGNGRLGAMVFSGVESERLQLNEESVWSKGEKNEDKPDGYKSIPQIQKLLFDGKYVEAQNLCLEKLMSVRWPSETNTYNSYQTLGDINISFSGVSNYTDYHRELDLECALVKTTFSSDRINHTRTVFSSAVDQALILMAEADKPGQISCSINLSRPGEDENISIQDGLFVMSGRAILRDTSVTQYFNDGEGVLFEARMQVIPHGGSMYIDNSELVIENADRVEIRLVAATDYRGGKPDELCLDYLKGLESKKYEQLLADHINEYQFYFKRVSLEIPGSEAAGFATDDRIDAQKRGVYDPSLTSLYFQFGRYLLISSSRPGCMPANLQGIWADGLMPVWAADYHLNINTQMNYWPSEVTNLSECHLPFLEFIGELRENGRKTARETYGVNGL